MKYLLDTCVVSDFIKGEAGVLSRLKSEKPKNLAISSVSLMEIEYGLALNPARTKKISPVINTLLKMLTIIPYDPMDAKTTASIRAYLKTEGTPIGPYDVMIAGCAFNHGLIMVTSNTNVFNRVIGLVLQDWR